MNAIYRFTDNATVVGQISNNNESKYGREIEGLVMWCNENNLSLNVGKTKELIIDFRKEGGEHALIYINGTEVETVKRIKFLGVTITEDINVTVKKAQQRLFFLRQLRKYCVQDHKKLQKVVYIAQTIMEANFPSMDSIYTARCCGKAAKIIKDQLHP
eukprot:g22072.t1